MSASVSILLPAPHHNCERQQLSKLSVDYKGAINIAGSKMDQEDIEQMKNKENRNCIGKKTQAFCHLFVF